MRYASACAFILLSGCVSMPTLEGTRWLAEDIDGRGVIDNAQSTLDIDADRASGRGGCNRFSGEVQIAANSIRFGELASTRMACVPALMDQEDRYLRALREVRSWKIENTKLLLLDSAGNVRLRLDPLTGTG